MTAAACGSRARATPPAGFTLIEMALALMVVTLLLGSLLVPLRTQVEQRKISETQRTLEQATEALLGFASIYGRLPCPASATSNGFEDPAGGGNCSHPYDGYFPSATVGLGPTDAQGYLLDAWGFPQSRIRYAASNNSSACSSHVFTTANGVKNCWGQITGGSVAPNLTVCSTASGIVSLNCAAGATLTNSAPALLYSLGANAASGSAGADEAQNVNIDRVFVWHTQSGNNAPNGEFDDIVAWLSPNVLYGRLISAGRLP